MKEHSNDRDKAEQSAHQRKNRGKGRAKRVWGVIGTIVLVGVLTMAIFVGIFMTYINKSLKGHVEVDMSEYDRKVSTELYRLGTDGETWEMYQTLFSDENRIWVDIGDIPKYLQEATIAIEDKRFETHHGVDWKGTLRAITRTLTGSGTQGGSTITQQLLKNVTGDNQVTVKRKITEIYRALALEKDYSKSQILEMYLNTIYLGEQCYGVQTAARMYFHKDVKDLTLAECACLIGITNNPSMYDPLLSDWTRENNRERQLTILGEMLSQEKIDQATYDAAAAEEVQFSDGYTNLGNFTEPTEDQETPEKPTVQSTANNSYYTDQVISDVAAALVEKLGLEDDAPDENGNVRTAQEKAVSKIYSSGYKIYTLQDSKLQSIAESVFETAIWWSILTTTASPCRRLSRWWTIPPAMWWLWWAVWAPRRWTVAGTGPRSPGSAVLLPSPSPTMPRRWTTVPSPLPPPSTTIPSGIWTATAHGPRTPTPASTA